MRLTKGETNELLNSISEDNYVYGLIFKLIYLYGKEGMLVLSLKWTDINLEDNTIRFKNHKFPLSRFVEDELLRLSEEKNDDDVYLFLENTDDISYGIDVYRKKLRYYLQNNVKRLENVTHKVKHVSLSITDLRRLRGQHLFLDGVGLDLIMDLYLQSTGTSTQFKRYLEYDELLENVFPCRDFDDLFGAYTDLNIFDFESPRDSVLNFAVSYSDGDFMIFLGRDGVGFYDDGLVSDYVKSDLLKLFDSGVLDSLRLLGDAEYLDVGGFSFVKL